MDAIDSEFEIIPALPEPTASNGGDTSANTSTKAATLAVPATEANPEMEALFSTRKPKDATVSCYPFYRRLGGFSGALH